MQGMGILSWIVFGLVAGLIARAVTPGRGPTGCVVTTLIGIAGALIGGFIATFLNFGGVMRFDFRSLVVAVLGSIVLLLVARTLSGPRRS